MDSKNQSKICAERPTQGVGSRSIQNLKFILSVQRIALAVEGSKIDWLILLAIIFIPRLLNLDVFLTADEPLFLAHARNFATAFSTGDFSQTLGIGYPGVTVAGWAAPVIDLAQTEMGAFAAGRAAIGLLTGLLMLALYGLARPLLGRWPAVIGVALLAFDPYSLAYSRLLHIAAPLALFMTLSGLAFLLWLREAHWRWLLLTGLFTGLALLTKSTALLLGPMLGAMLIGWAVAVDRWQDWSWWGRKLSGSFIMLLISMVVFFVLWPAMWVSPAETLNLTFGKLFTDQEAGAGNLGLFWLGQFVEDPGPAFYPVAFILKSTPWLLVGLFLSLVQLFTRSTPVKSKILNSEPLTLNSELPTLNSKTLCLWLFALTYLIIMTIASKKSIRYMLPAFPVFYLLAGSGYYQAWHRFKNRTPFKNLPRFPAPVNEVALPRALSLSLILSLSLFISLYHPYYFTYYNPLVLGWRWAPQTLLVGWGEGLDGAARYLNTQSARNVAVWYEWLVPILYQGYVQPVVPQENLITADKTVLYINQVQRDIPGPNIIHYFQTRRRPEHTVRLNGIDYAWVYPGPIAGFRPDPAPQYPLGGEFGGEARLLGYDLHPQPVAGGETLIVTLYWRVLTTPSTERFVYLRLVDEQGHVWAGADSPPVMGLWPVANWQSDSLIEDAQALSVPPGTPPGVYRLEIGLYDPDSGRVLAAQGQSSGQGGGLLLGEVNLEWQSLRAEANLPHQADTRLAPEVRLVGYTSPPPAATTGDSLSISLAWRESSTLGNLAAFSRWLDFPNDFVMFEWRQAGQRLAEQLDPLPLPVEQWGRKALLNSRHDLIVPPTLATGRYDLYVMLHNSSDPAGDAFLLGSIEVTAPPHQFDLPTNARTRSNAAHFTVEANQKIALPGYELSSSGQGLDLILYWQTDAPLAANYKVFAQLLTADNTLLAQSDAIPANGERPTTGWLPGEIIADSHTLNFEQPVPPGSYLLITGFYNPVNGQRLPILNEAGETIADAMVVAEVELP